MKPHIITYDSLDSTMEEAKRLLEQDFQRYKDAIIIAKQQTHGRGRHGRQWISPSGNLYMSMIVKDLLADLLSEYALLWGIVLHEVISDLILAHHKVQCKWPNDILINDKKIGGILIERYNKNKDTAMIVGIGINVGHCPEQVQFPASSLKELGVQGIELEDLVSKISEKYKFIYQQWKKDGFAFIREKWLGVAWRLKQEISIRQEQQSVVGIFETINAKGAIEIKDHNGVMHTLHTGDLFKEKMDVTHH